MPLRTMNPCLSMFGLPLELRLFGDVHLPMFWDAWYPVLRQYCTAPGPVAPPKHLLSSFCGGDCEGDPTCSRHTP